MQGVEDQALEPPDHPPERPEGNEQAMESAILEAWRWAKVIEAKLVQAASATKIVEQGPVEV